MFVASEIRWNARADAFASPADRVVLEVADADADASGPRWVLTDSVGSPRFIVPLSGRTEDIVHRLLLPFGEEVPLDVASSPLVRQHFTSYERDAESGLDFAQARYYAPPRGRFLSVDPQSASARAADPQSWNRYTYVGNRPTVFVDPSGASWVSIRHGGGVGMGRSIHAGQVCVADGTDLAAQKLERVLTNDPGMGVIRHVDAGYEEAVAVAAERGVRIPMQEA